MAALSPAHKPMCGLIVVPSLVPIISFVAYIGAIMVMCRIGYWAAIGITFFVGSALAGPSSPAPGPIVGIGLPALALVGGVYWVGRKLLARKK
jgi:hypothetical protein